MEVSFNILFVVVFQVVRQGGNSCVQTSYLSGVVVTVWSARWLVQSWTQDMFNLLNSTNIIL